MTRGAIRHAVRAGRLHRLHPGVYATIPPELLSGAARLVAALLAGGPDAVLSHQTAAHRQELIAVPPPAIQLASPRCLVPPPGVALHRCTTLRSTDVTTTNGLRSTTVPRTLLDLAVTYERSPLLDALAEAEFHHDLRPDDVLRVLRRGHPGSARLRAALAEHVPGHGEARSRLERAFRRLLIAAGIPLPERNAEIGPYLVDCLWRAEHLVVELDGGQHERPRQAAVDAARDLYLRAHGYLVVRYTRGQVRDAPQAALADVRANLARSASLEGTNLARSATGAGVGASGDG